MKKFTFFIPTGNMSENADFHSYFIEHLAEADTGGYMRRISSEKRGSRIIATEGVGRTCFYSSGDRCSFFYGFDADAKKSYCSAHKDEDVCVPLINHSKE